RQIGYMLDAVKGVDLVEALVLERQPLGIHCHQSISYGVRDCFRIQIDPGSPGRELVPHAMREESAAAANFQDAIFPARLQVATHALEMSPDLYWLVEHRVFARTVRGAPGHVVSP